MKKNQIGVIGLAVMGKNIALNIANKGYLVAVYNRTWAVTNKIMEQHSVLHGYERLEDFVNSLEKPRKILLMVKAGQAVDALLEQLIDLLDRDDIVMDGGNSYYLDTIAREQRMAIHGIHYMGVGISGGEEGALHGPAMMPGGNKQTYDLVRDIFEAISAKAEGEACVSYIGENGAGHYVKMVHNGIEYGDMQLIAESYDLLKHLGGFDNEQLAAIFAKYNTGKLQSYLIEITKQVLKAKDNLGDGYLVDKILDVAGQKGTGKWTIQSSLDLGQVTSVMSAAVYNRFLSSLKEERVHAERVFDVQRFGAQGDRERLVELIEKSLYFAKIMSYAQGFSLMSAAAKEYQWDLNFQNIAKGFRAGCIIRARFLNDIAMAYEKNPNLENLMLDPFFMREIKESEAAMREVVVLAVSNGISVAGFSNALAYFDGYTNGFNPANLIQGQRDFFGAHTYERVDLKGVYHYDWFV